MNKEDIKKKAIDTATDIAKDAITGAAKETVKTTKKSSKVGRNDLCPCGSGKKYKQCCGK